MKALLLLLVAAQASAQAPEGAAQFARNCAACHQLDGAGVAGAFPALKGNAFVQGEATPVIATVLKGRGGMPAFARALDDDSLAQVLSYVRQAWGNQAGAIEPAQVQAVRATIKADNKRQGRPRVVH
ncbi:MAG: cytochrome c [Pseudomonadota bacterium]